MPGLREHEATVNASASEQLTPIAIRILDIRSAFLDHLSSLRAPFNELAKKHYFARLVRAEDRHMLGEYAPLLLQDVLQVPGSVVSDITIPWLVLYEYALVIDDAIDRRDESLFQGVVLGQVLFADAVSLWQERLLKYPNLWEAFSKYHTEWMAATLEELTGTSASSPMAVSDFTQIAPTDYLIMGHKNALVKFCATAISEEHRSRPLDSREEEGIDKLCTGIQLLDDLSDSIEDYRHQRNGFPFRTAIEQLRRYPDSKALCERVLSDDEIVSVLLLSGVAAQIATSVSIYLSDGLADLQVPADSPTARYLLSLIENTSRSAGELADILVGESATIDAMILALCEGELSFSQLIGQPRYWRVWAEMKRCFEGIPTASN